MNLTFRLRFHTRPGQSLAIAGNHPLPDHPVPLTFLDSQHWQVSVPLTAKAATLPLTYAYVFSDADSRSTDWMGERHLIPANFNCTELLVLDAWNNPGNPANAFFTTPFKNVLLLESFTEIKKTAPKNPTHTFQIQAPLLQKNQTLCLLGTGAVLGDWKTENPVLLNRIKGKSELSVSLDLRGQKFPFEYKYGVFDCEQQAFVRFEAGENRILNDVITNGKYTLVNDGFVNLPTDTWRGAGVAVPVFSLRSENSFGVGEFLDLKPLANWGKKVGLKLIQLLPVNDTSATNSWKDSYPYAAISAFALHPIYLNLAAVTASENKKMLRPLESQRKQLNQLEAVDYETVMQVKLAFLRRLFPLQKTATFRTKAYKEFFAENEHWLTPYAAFCSLRDQFGTADFSQWPEHSVYSAEKISALAQDNDSIAFYFFLQFHLHLQLQSATAHVHAAGMVIKGDIAIGVYRHGADAWQAPELFHMEMQAGAPPDPFAAKGQNWGFPTYNWPRMAADGFAWWKQRFAQMTHYFDAFRIDHILGFFRIWSSPAHAVEGILGYFVPAIAVTENEFHERGIPFDSQRLTQPFITDFGLREIFGDETAFVQQTFLTKFDHGFYQLKPNFATQRQVENYFTNQNKSANPTRLKKIKLGLFDLISNVILLEVDGNYHFRFAMEQTTSFKNLPPLTQTKLRELYVDYFFRRQDVFWKREALQKLPALKRVTKMLICGEDLGLVPACVPEVMRDLGFLSLEIQRMPKFSGQEFLRPADAPHLSVVTPGTHDMSTIRGWWTEDRAFSQRFFNGELKQNGEAPSDCPPEIVRAIIQQHLESPAMWSIFQLQDLLGLDESLRHQNIESERINVPAIPNFYWRYRLHLTLEKLGENKKFNSHLAQLLRENGRG